MESILLIITIWELYLSFFVTSHCIDRLRQTLYATGKVICCRLVVVNLLYPYYFVTLIRIENYTCYRMVYNSRSSYPVMSSLSCLLRTMCCLFLSSV